MYLTNTHADCEAVTRNTFIKLLATDDRHFQFCV